jgi:hypothetical protein
MFTAACTPGLWNNNSPPSGGKGNNDVPPAGEEPDTGSEPPVEEPDGYLGIEFTFSPGLNYSVLLEERYDSDEDLFVRHFLRFDGFLHTETEETLTVALPEKFAGRREARAWVLEQRPDKLELVPRTFVVDRVLARWRDEGYDFEHESKNMISLDYLKFIGALTKTNEHFIIYHEPETLESLIKWVADEFLPADPNLHISGNVEIEEQSFMYHISLLLLEDDSADVLVGADVELYYLLTSTGEPEEFSLKASFHDINYLERVDHDELISEIAFFVLALKEELTAYFGISGVRKLEYQNITMMYDIAEGGGGYAEVYQLDH